MKINTEFGYSIAEIHFADDSASESDSSSSSSLSIEESSDDENIKVELLTDYLTNNTLNRKRKREEANNTIQALPKPSPSRPRIVVGRSSGYQPPRKRIKKNVENPFPESVYNLLTRPIPSLEFCTKVVKPSELVERNQKRPKPEWYVQKTKEPSIAMLTFKDKRWEKWKIVHRAVTVQDSAKDSIIQISTRGSKRFVQIINGDYIDLRVKMTIHSSNGHILADPLKVLDQSDKTRFIPQITCTRRVTNTNPDEAFRILELRLPPRSECTLLQLGPPNPTCPFEYSTELKFGDPSVKPDHRYRWMVPIQIKEPILCSQGFNGCITHNGKFRYSVDIAVDEGTPVICPRDGIVVDYVCHFRETGTDQSFETKTNYLTIAHSDGTVSEYVHLKHKGVLAELGEVVKRGQVIAYSGNTGWSYGPHLHFHVRENANKGSSTIPYKFDDGTGNGIELLTGHYYY